jgi:hypothetical protein
VNSESGIRSSQTIARADSDREGQPNNCFQRSSRALRRRPHFFRPHMPTLLLVYLSCTEESAKRRRAVRECYSTTLLTALASSFSSCGCSSMKLNLILAAWLALPASFGGSAWDKPPTKWDLADIYRILEDSPWDPAEVKLEAKGASRLEDTQTGIVTDSPINSTETTPVPAVQVNRGKTRPAIPVVWWSAKTIRLAEKRLLQLQHRGSPTDPLQVEELPDYVLLIEGSEPWRILHDAKEDLHDTVFLELSDGGTLDLASVNFVDGSDDQEPRVEFHFPRQIDGQPTIDPDSERVILHCRATVRTPRPFQENTLSFRAEFKPKTMRVRGAPDL